MERCHDKVGFDASLPRLLERDAIDMEHGTRNGSVSTLEVNWEKDLDPEATKHQRIDNPGGTQ